MSEGVTVLLCVCVNSDGNDKWMPIMVGESLKLHCFKHTNKLPMKLHKKAWVNTAIFIGFSGCLMPPWLC
jgi:hypothetical protein